MHLSTRPVPRDDGSDEVTSLASEVAAAYRRMTVFYHHQMEMALPEADRRARGRDYTPEEAAADTAHIQDQPPDQVGWFELTRLLERDPDAFEAIWTGMKRQARQELASGQRTAKALEWQGSPWDRARFLALRESFRSTSPPQTGIESALLDSAAEAFTDYLECTEYQHMQIGTEVKSERNRIERDGYWEPPRLSSAEAVEHSSTMSERAHRRFLRTVAALGSLRRTGSVLVSQGGQVNIAQQQILITRVTAEDEDG